MMRKIALLFVALLLLSSCAQTEAPEDEFPSSSSSSSTTSVTSSSFALSTTSSLSSSSSAAPLPLSAMGGALVDWAQAWKVFLPAFGMSSMQKVRSSAMKPSIAAPLVEHEDILALQGTLDYPILFPAQDGQTVIYISPSDAPDTEVAIIKPFANLYERHLYCGTPCSYDSAVWIDNAHVVITGFSQYYPANGEERCTETTLCTIVPTLHVFDLQNGTMTEYWGPEVDETMFLERELGE